MRGIYADASGGMDEVFERVYRPGEDPDISVFTNETVLPEQMPGLYSGYQLLLNDHTFLPTEAITEVEGLRHIIFLGTGARSYMDVKAIERLGISVHTIRGYGDTAVA